ncbi:hypothetical protein [Acinetobacter sp. DSM 11652]|uniref:hypothetical protein n=1 Tax=Acinetobacter sp. DSM 11652 TaxID=346222 RepID=UPI0008ADE128|nr:hypothetical protein [Acinetobacter sp. DSM 11652]SEM18864.1 hypothetical protein SAMN05216500_11352 [Acinetobacter sp. DSM 11652]
MNILNDMEKLFKCNTKNKTILYLYLSFIYIHVDSPVIAEKIDIEDNFVKARNIIFKELIDNFSFNHVALIITDRKECPFIDLGKSGLENINFFYENIKLLKESGYKQMNQICRKIRENILCFESIFLSEIIRQSYDIKKGNLFKLLVLEFVIQAVYLCDYLFAQKKTHEMRVLNKISIDFFDEIKSFLINFDYKINIISSNYADLTKNCINQRKKSVIEDRKMKSLNIIKGDKIRNYESNIYLLSNRINEMYEDNKKYPEVVKLFKKNLCDRKVITSKDYLDEIITKAIDQTKNLYWNNNKENVVPSELRKVLEQWIATEFKGFCERKGIKFHNMISVFIMQCKAKL